MLPAGTARVWVENKKILRVEFRRGRAVVKPRSPGRTRLRTGGRLYRITVSPPETRAILQTWRNLQNRFVGMHAGLCGPDVCLSGPLYRLRDYRRLAAWLENGTASETGARPEGGAGTAGGETTMLLALEPAPELQPALQQAMEEQFRRAGLPPLKLQPGRPWTVQLAPAAFTPENRAKLARLGIRAEALPQAVETAENIKVSVRILEITRNFERKLGVHWPDQYSARVLDLRHFETENGLELALNAAEKSGEARILASPTLICRSGKEADFFAGGEFPVKILGPRSREVVWKRYGIGMKLRPRIDPLGQMSLQLDTEVSTLDRSISVDDVPALHTNRVSSFFDLTAGRTIAISGLIKSEISENFEGLPWLKNLPVLGALFSSRNFQTNKSELVILVSPALMK